jgi:hypothetical protein
MAQKPKGRRCHRLKIAIAYALLQIVALSAAFFVRNWLDLSTKGGAEPSEAGDETVLLLSSGGTSHIRFGDENATVFDCYLLSRKERLNVVSYIQERWKGEGKHRRSSQSLEGELALHSFAYRLGIDRESSKDADLGVYEDERWSVRELSGLIEFMGC